MSIEEMLAGNRESFTEVKFTDHEYAQWLRKHKAIDYWVSHPPIGDICINEHFKDSEKTRTVSYAIIDNRKMTMRVFLRDDLKEGEK